MCVADASIARRMNISKSSLFTPLLNVSVADNADLQLTGAAFLQLTTQSGQTSKQMVYFADGIRDFYLSKEACRDLKLIDEDFPAADNKDLALTAWGRVAGSNADQQDQTCSPQQMVPYSYSPPVYENAPPVPEIVPKVLQFDARQVSPQDWCNYIQPTDVQSGAYHPRDINSFQDTPQTARGRVYDPKDTKDTHITFKDNETKANQENGYFKDPMQNAWRRVYGHHHHGEVHKVKDTHDHQGRPLAPCGCLLRTPPPPPPQHPPFSLHEHNIQKVQDWILNRYEASAFNTCTHQTLPKMSGLPPLRIITKDNVEPVAIHKPSTIPVHWLEEVRQELEQDIALGVIERVPSNTPTTWCSRMHVVGKKTGKPRCVVDLCALNKATTRQTHHTEPPFKQAMGVPANMWRYTTDAWNGYHSVPLDPQDRHKTTFITLWGRMRYLVAPQGSLSSGDGFTYWYDLLIRTIKRIKKCVDDVLGWAETLTQLFFMSAISSTSPTVMELSKTPPSSPGVDRKLTTLGSGY